MKTLKIFSLMLAMALVATEAHAERVAYRVAETDAFEYIVELSDTKSERCGPLQARVLMSVAMRGSSFPKPVAEGCWRVEGEEVVANLWSLDTGKYIELRNYFTEYTVSP